VTPVCHPAAHPDEVAAPSPPRRPKRPVLYGRAAEIRQLMQAFRDAAGGHSRVVVISGPAGLGKTRLADELAERAATRGARVGIGRCWHDGQAPPLWPWRQILDAVGAPDDLLSADAGESPHDRFARFVAVREHLRLRAAAAPLVIVLDDAHLADPASLLLARFLVRERRGLAALFVFTRRDEIKDLPGSAMFGDVERDASWIQLAGLPAPVVRTFLASFGLPPVNDQLLAVVSTITRGNPLQVRSVALRSVSDGNVVSGLERTLGDSIAQLSPLDRPIVGTAALLGMDVVAAEVVRVTEAPAALVAEALAEAERLGLMERTPAGRLVFVHDLVREAALGALSATERLDADARAAVALGGADTASVMRRAHHALAAAPRSASDAAAAVRIAREATVALRALDGFEAAAAMLARAVDVDTSPAPADLMVEWAEAVLACGKLAEARPIFRRAAHLADVEGDAALLARAALGLGGVWLREHRMTDDSARVEALQRRALAALAPDADALRARLAVRLAAEEAYRGGPLEPVMKAVDAARWTGDKRALAEALSLCHHVLMSPEHSHARLAIADELIAAAAAAGDGVLTLIGLCWRATDLFLAGDPRAEPALDELRLRADALQCGSILFIVKAIDVMRRIRAGQFAEAEAQAAACYAFGVEIGDADALAYHGAHLAAIRLFQGREAELADVSASIAASPTLIIERERSFALAAALFALRAGRPEPARATLAQLARDGVASVPASSTWLTSMQAIVELAHSLHEPAIAEQAYEALLPYAELPVMASLAIMCMGSTHRPLGLAALTCGHHERAVDHLMAAMTFCERAAHRPAAIQARAELGLALIQRAAPGDVARGHALVEAAIAAGDAGDMQGLAARWRAALVAPRRSRAEAPTVAHATPSAQPGYWCVTVGADVATVADRVGMRYLARLLACPDRAVPVLALVADDGVPLPNGEAQDVIDRSTMTALRMRIAELHAQTTLTDDEDSELQLLTRELAGSLGRGGQARAFADAPERARTAVRKAIKRAIEQIHAASPRVGGHLAERVSTGSVCCYRTTAGS
jgi:hypothetical protein